MARRNWTREELLLALNLYCKLPFSKFSKDAPEIQKLSNIIDRTPGAVAMKLWNFASLDDSFPQTGLPNASRLDNEMWEEFTGDWEQVALKSELILEAKTHNKEIDVLFNEEMANPLSTETTQTIKARIGQQFFRSTILSNYNYCCCICEMPIGSLLIASHIVPWHLDRVNRLNPCNGLSLCVLHDKAFDRGLITLDEQYQVVLSSELKDLDKLYTVTNSFHYFQSKSIYMPEKFTPKQIFLEFHRNNIFIE